MVRPGATLEDARDPKTDSAREASNGHSTSSSSLNASLDESRVSQSLAEEDQAAEPNPISDSASDFGTENASLSSHDYADFDAVFALWRQTGDPQLRDRLILMQRSLVLFLARRFHDRGELYEDVVGIGMVGLINALDSFDPARGVKFSTFAIPTISGEIRRYFRDKIAGMRVPRRLQELYLQAQGRIEELSQQLGRSPTYAEIGRALGIEVEEVVEVMELGSAIDPTSLEEFAYSDSEGATLAETLGAPDPHLHAYEEHAALESALENLTEQERQVLMLAYFQGYSQVEIANRLSVSQMQVSRLLRRSLARLRELLEEV